MRLETNRWGVKCVQKTLHLWSQIKCGMKSLYKLNRQTKKNNKEMQQKIHRAQYDLEAVDSFKHLFCPKFPTSASPEEFLVHYEPLFEELRKLDLITEDEFKKLALYAPPPKQKFNDFDKLLTFIIDQLNDLCTFCHRKQLRIKISQELSCYKKNLKNIAVGKRPIQISHWQTNFLKKNFNLDSVEESLKPKITNILDKIYLEHRKIPNYYLLFLGTPELFINLYDFEEKLIFDSMSDKTSLPLVHKFYLGVIAASTYGSRYLWNFMVTKFLKYGGDPQWIETGLDELPDLLRKFGQASYQMAYNFNINIMEHICFEIGKIVEDSAILQGFYILSYFQFLACVSLAFGLIPESKEYQKLYLPQVAFLKPSPESFETMKRVSNKEARYENEMAKQFEEMYSWEKDSEKENYKRVELEKKSSTSKKNIEKGSSTKSLAEPNNEISYSNQLMITIEQEEMIKKLQSSRTMEYIKKVFSKYVEFDQQRRSLVQFKRKADKKTRVSNNTNEEGDQSNDSNSSEEDEFIYASEWNFETNTGPLIEYIVGQSFHKIACELLKGLKFVESGKSKNLKMYYESLQNYMYEYISYVSLINEGLSQAQKNYTKLLTRSPFLFNEKSFAKMKEDLESVCKIYEPFRFGLEVFSFKLQHSLTLASYAYNRYIEDK